MIEDFFNKKYLAQIFDEKVSLRFTRGIDGISVPFFIKDKSKNIEAIYQKIINSSYAFSPYLEKLINKGRSKGPRVISIPTVRDRIVLVALKDLLHYYFPNEVQRSLPNEYVRDIKSFLEHAQWGDLCYYKSDIKSFYDEIDQNILIAKLESRIHDSRIINLIEHALKNPTVPRNYNRKTKYKYYSHKGVPQGLAISNILANIYMAEYDETVSRKCTYFRYVDDILIFNHGHPNNCVKDYSESLLNKIGLELNKGKSFCKEKSDTFEYLGYHFNIPKISVRDSTVQRFVNKLASMFVSFKKDFNKPQKSWITKALQKGIFIDALNERITGAISNNRRYGWLFYFLEINDLQVLHKIDSIVVNFFKRLNMFDNNPPDSLKKMAKAYYHAKHSPLDGYINNYNQYSTREDKLKYLVQKGLINPEDKEKTYAEDEISIMFNQHKNMMLSYLDLDIGTIS